MIENLPVQEFETFLKENNVLTWLVNLERDEQIEIILKTCQEAFEEISFDNITSTDLMNLRKIMQRIAKGELSKENAGTILVNIGISESISHLIVNLAKKMDEYPCVEIDILILNQLNYTEFCIIVEQFIRRVINTGKNKNLIDSLSPNNTIKTVANRFLLNFIFSYNLRISTNGFEIVENLTENYQMPKKHATILIEKFSSNLDKMAHIIIINQLNNIETMIKTNLSNWNNHGDDNPFVV